MAAGLLKAGVRHFINCTLDEVRPIQPEHKAAVDQQRSYTAWQGYFYFIIHLFIMLIGRRLWAS